MLRKECSIMDKDEDVNQYYDWLMIPQNSPDESKTGVTFKGSDD